ncbi:MAG: hypothetical protein QM535_10925 [Limnohabitans sp.]|nr:hypothetical protein [Limnohabitans sp.]
MRRILILTISVLLLSCRDKAVEFPDLGIYFNATQPANVSEISSIPREFRGIYMSSDSVFIRVLKDKILYEDSDCFKIHKNALDSLKNDFTVFEDRWVSKILKDTFRIKTFKDSILFRSKKIDTFYIFSKNSKMIKIGKHLVINSKDSIFWRVNILTLEKKSLFVNYVGSNPFELERFDSITKIKSK